MVNKKSIRFLAGAGIIRYLLMVSKYAPYIRNRVEVSTPLNSWKRVQEGAFLYNMGVNPYSGDLYHENPIILVLTNFLINNYSQFINIICILIDLCTALLLYLASERFITEMAAKENGRKSHTEFEKIKLTSSVISQVPIQVLAAYLFNPYSIMNCIGCTTTVWSNFLLAAFLFGMSRKNVLLTTIALGLETQRNLYPFSLIVPAAIYFYKARNERTIELFKLVITFVIVLIGLNAIAYFIMDDWSFIDATYGFIFYHRDLQPNIGLFWYFFTEMFEHFHQMFLYTFQLNATILYLLPLSVKLRNEPILLATILAALNTVFRSYPCVGDVALYLSLLPLWSHTFKFMGNNFIVFCVFLITSVFGPVVWYLWIYVGSANANFYFGATLGFATAQIFLISDLLFAYNKREFCLTHGTNLLNKIALE